MGLGLLVVLLVVQGLPQQVEVAGRLLVQAAQRGLGLLVVPHFEVGKTLLPYGPLAVHPLGVLEVDQGLVVFFLVDPYVAGLEAQVGKSRLVLGPQGA